jgi:6-phosphogluconolactonase (cycloisomerase 2 family)
MPYYMYVSLQDDDKIRVFTMDAATGQLTPQGEVPVSGGPSPLAISPDRKVLYVGIAMCQRSPASALTQTPEG